MRITTLTNLAADPAGGLAWRGTRGESFRIDVLDDDLVRVRVLPDGAARLDRTWMVVGDGGTAPREGRLRDDLSPFRMPEYARRDGEGVVEIETAKLRLKLHLETPQIEWFDLTGRRFAADLAMRAYTYDRTGSDVWHYLTRRTDEHYYGLGERGGDLDKAGRRFRMLNLDAMGYNAETGDRLYKHFPFYITYIPELDLAYGLFYDNLSTTIFDMGNEVDAFWGHYRYWNAAGGDVDYTLIFGETIEGVVTRLSDLIGRPMLPPRATLGYLGSTMSYTEMPDAQAQLANFVRLCEEHDIPCDLFHLSSGYTTDAAGLRNVFTWNKSRVPDPEAMVKTFHDAGIMVAANIKPYLLTTHPYFEEVKALGGFITDPDTGDPILTRFWSGGAFTSGEGAYIDFSNPVGFEWWQARVKDALLEVGIDAAWNDNNEFEIWDDEAVCDGFGKPLPLGLGRPIQTLLMAQASFEITRDFAPDKRPYVLTRAGCPGIQRYAQTWSGDNATSWHTLRWNIPMGLGMSLSGMPNIGHDVGGFYGEKPDPELFVRWVQNGIYHPRFTIHSWNTDQTTNEPWMHPEVLPLIREAIQWRYRMLPFLYSLLVESHRTGAPIIRPLVYHFPHDARCRTESFDFMLGSHLLVASVIEPGARTRRVYLPAGTWWCDFHTSQWYEGGQEIEVDAPLDRVPLFVRDGGMIPLGKVMRHVGAEADDLREVLVFMRDEAAEFVLFEDDGISNAYQEGIYSEIHLRIERSEEHENLIMLGFTHHGYDLPYTEIDLNVVDGKRESGRWRVTVDMHDDEM